VDRLRALAATIDGDLVAARLEHVEALAEGDAARLDAASSVFDGLGASLLAAEAATDAAAAWRADGRRQRADAALARAGALAEDCPDAHTPALVPVALRERLTEAERGTALLAVAGRTNRQIAQELGLSIRTIDNRLQRTYTKLGISSRAELARLVR
ncbi:MAG: LuxR family transcriptional regulator, partial [Actinobacteria bacterium]|nr:LuxR family transcriptional regulator [Actinomycetota bacterium]